MKDQEITLSPTRVKRWVRCKKSYYWRYDQHLVRERKTVPMSLGLVVGEALAEYYRLPPEKRDSDVLTLTCLDRSLKLKSSEFLGEEPSKGLLGDWEKISSTALRLLSTYHDWAVEKDDFEVVEVETSRKIELVPGIYLLAIPDTVVNSNELNLILEHKVRHKYRSGDFGIDYQSVASCLVTESIGTLYNVCEYSKLKFHRDPIMRSEDELDFFRKLFIHVGRDILSSSPDQMYPMPFKRCACEYWELCNAEIGGLDLDDIINELYIKTAKPEKERESEGPGE